MTRANRLRACVVAWLLGAALTAMPAWAEESRDSAHCLPADAWFVLRVPGGKAFLNTLRAETELGKTILSKERMDKIAAAMRESGSGNWDRMNADLAKYNLKPEEWSELFAGDAGVGLVARKVEGRKPLPVLLVWTEPGEDLAGRIEKAVRQVAKDNEGKADAWRITDFEVDGWKGVRITTPIFAPAAAAPLQFPDNFALMTPEERKKWREEQTKKNAEQPAREVDRSHVLMVRKGGKMLLGMTGREKEQGAVAEPPANEKGEVDWAKWTGQAELIDEFGKFVKLHAAKPDGADGLSKMSAARGLGAALPAGTTVFELYMNPAPIVDMAVIEANDPKAEQVVKAFGIKGLGTVAFKAAYDKGAMRAGMFASAPAPRLGLLSLLDQNPIPAEPAAWVPATAASYGHLSFDLGKAYVKIKEMVIAEFGDEANQQYAMVEMQVQQIIQADLPTLLSALGTNHAMMMLPPDPKKPDNAPRGEFAPPVNPDEVKTALVWKTKDDAVLQRVINAIQLMAGGGGGLAPLNREGFQGFLVKAAPMDAGMMLGKGFMSVAMGKGVPELTMTTIATPPDGDKAMRGGELFAESKKLMPPAPTMAFWLGDMRSAGRGFRDGVMTGMERTTRELAAKNPTIKADELMARLRVLMPTDEEIARSMGVGVGQAVVTDDGLRGTMGMALPPPK